MIKKGANSGCRTTRITSRTRNPSTPLQAARPRLHLQATIRPSPRSRTMVTSEIIFLAAIACIGIPAAWFNLTAAGMVISYIVSQLVWRVTGDPISVPSMLLCDYLVIVLAIAKPDAHKCYYTSLASQMYALWGERTNADKIILSIFPLAWFCYAVEFNAFYRWWALWWMAMLQLLVAGWEGYSVWQQRPREKDHSSPDIASLRLAWSGHV